MSSVSDDRFNTIITSLKSLDESSSSRNHVRKFLRALPAKWRPKVMAIEESKDMSNLSLDELIDSLKVYEVVLEKNFEISKIKKDKYKSLALEAKKESSDEETSTSGSKDEEYVMAVRELRSSLEEEEDLLDIHMMTRKLSEKSKMTRKKKANEGALNVMIQVTS
ncbi:hypothetical protein Tco_0093242 [Tanacetum coccineum]